MSAPYPWQQPQWDQLQRAARDGRLAHALLLTAPEGTGLRAFAEHWTRWRLCLQPLADAPCGHCPGCEQVEVGTHPDVVRVEPEEAGKAIGIDAVRAMIERITLTAGTAGKIALVDPADAMTLQAANSLLKTLEEPPAGSTILLLAQRPSRLPATVRSRCQAIAFGVPARAGALEWLRRHGGEAADLARAGGAPLLALEQARTEDDAGTAVVEALLGTLERGRVDPDDVARIAPQPLQRSVPLLASVMADLIRVGTAAAGPQHLRFPELRERLEPLAGRLDVRAMFLYLDELNRAVPGPSSGLRPEMQIQGLLADAARVRGARVPNAGGA